MVIRHSPFWLKLFFIMLFLSAGTLWAQNTGSSQGGFFLDTTPRFFQRFTWTASDGAMRYEVIIEQNEGGQNRRILQEFTTELFVEVSLSPGTYRYRVIPYDFLNRPGQATEWKIFEIIAAVNPQLESFIPALFDMAEKEHELIISGRNIGVQAEIFLRHLGSGFIIVSDSVEILQGGTEARLLFDSEKLNAGVYMIHVRNPGGLEANIGYLSIINSRDSNMSESDFESEVFSGAGFFSTSPLNFNFGVAWMPLIFNSITDNGAALCLGMITSSANFLNIGLELTVSWYSIDDFFHRALLIENNFLLQKQFLNRKLAFTFRAGMGLIFPADEINAEEDADNEIDPLKERALFANAGISIMWMPFSRLYLEAGINYSFVFIVDNYSGFLRPWVGIGTKF